MHMGFNNACIHLSRRSINISTLCMSWLRWFTVETILACLLVFLIQFKILTTVTQQIEQVCIISTLVGILMNLWHIYWLYRTVTIKKTFGFWYLNRSSVLRFRTHSMAASPKLKHAVGLWDSGLVVMLFLKKWVLKTTNGKWKTLCRIHKRWKWTWPQQYSRFNLPKHNSAEMLENIITRFKYI